jgi:proteic killer suppression protein
MIRTMEIEFADHQLALIETERAADTKLPVAVIQSARQRLSIIRAAPDVRTMQNWRSLGLKPRGTGSPEHLVILAPQWAMVLRIEEKNSAMTVIVRAMEEQTRGAA